VTADELLEVAKPSLVALARTNPAALVDAIATVTDDGQQWRLAVHKNVEATIALLVRLAPGLDPAKLRARASATTAPVVLITRDGGVFLETFSWTALLGEMVLA